MAAFLALILLACGRAPTDEDRYLRVLELARTDLPAAVLELDRIEDPLLRTAAIMDLVATPGLRMAPDQAEELCQRCPTAAEARVCRTRFASTHLSTQR